MSQMKSIALAALLGLAGLSGNANAASPNPNQARVYAQADRTELTVRLDRDEVAKSQDNPWAVISPSGANIQSRAGFVGYH